MLRNLSFRYKIPLRGTVLILITSIAVTAALIFRSYDDLKQDLLANAEGMGRIMAHTLVPALLKDDVWRAYELISAPLVTKLDGQELFRADSILVLDNQHNIYVASDPSRYPMLSALKQISEEYLQLEQRISTSPSQATEVIDIYGNDSLHITSPIVSDTVRLGTLVISYRRSSFTPRFTRFATRALVATIIVLTILVPLSWFWGIRMANPLINLAHCMGRVGQERPSNIDCTFYESRDEIGQLSTRFKAMIAELKVKQELEEQMISAERLAAVGKLAASIGHEINNPLGGMLNALNTYQRYGKLDEMASTTTSLLERGLLQIKETVSALLVEAKPTKRHFGMDDANDIRTLIAPDLQRHGVTLQWMTKLYTIPLSATLIRQVLINLLLNAITATPEGGEVGCYIVMDREELSLIVANTGEPIPTEQLNHLFEPFVHYHPDGSGIGLWVCYQIVHQLGGTIQALSEEQETRFTATIPVPNNG